MSDLGQKLAEARAEVVRLERLAKVASCAELGHPKKFVGCCACCCDTVNGPGTGECSLPVHSCACGDSDYGENAEAEAIKAGCRRESEAMELPS